MTASNPLPVSDVRKPACGCGCTDVGEPELDVRAIPVGGSLRLVAPHDPKPLLTQVAEREHGAFEVTYLVSGPDAWTLRLSRHA